MKLPARQSPDHGIDRPLNRSMLLGCSAIDHAARCRAWPGIAGSLPLFRALLCPSLRSAASGADTAI